MAKRFFVTGTDTDAGKTLISSALLVKAQAEGFTTLAMKPLAAGAELIDGEQKNPDAARLQSLATEQLSYQQVNPILLETPAAPHICADKEGRLLSASRLTGFIQGFFMNKADYTFVEGAGGWLVPLNKRETLADAIKPLDVGVILVVGVKLGCLNHALLTARAIRTQGLRLVGWVGSQVSPNMRYFDENIQTLKDMLPAPCLGVVPFLDDATAEAAAEYLDLSLLN